MSKSKVENQAKTVKTKSVQEKNAFSFSVILSTLMCFSFTTMFAQTYEIPFSYLLFIPAVLAYSAIVSYLIFRNRGKQALAFVLISVVVTASVAAAEYYRVFDILHLRNSVQFLLCKLREFTFHDLELSFIVSASGELSVAVLFFLVGMIPTALTCWVILRKKNVLFSIGAFLPYFALTIALNYSFPSQWSCQIALGCVVVLVLFQNIRKHEDKYIYLKIFKIFGAVMVILFVIGIISPQSRYDKEKLAQKEMELATSLYKHASRILSDIPGSFTDLVEKFTGDIPDGVKFEPIEDTGTEYLNLAGMVDVEEVHLMDVTRRMNTNYKGTRKYDDRYMYLKTWSKGKYTGQTWESDVSDMSFDESFLPEMEDRVEDCQYFVTVDVFRRIYRMPVPYYADFYTGTPDDYLQKNNSLTQLQTSNLNEKTDYFGSGSNSKFLFASGNIPVYIGGRLQDTYERVVRAEYLQVPTSTRERLLSSGLLPDWFVPVMNGQITMSDREKVQHVEDYVRSLHPYDENTKPMPQGEDFVVWFIKDSPTGFCVHYASTATILLRMLGVPTRYVDGYMLNTITGISTAIPVYSSDAHAWIEVFDNAYGWILCDPTPGNEVAESGFSFGAIYGDTTFTEPIISNPTNPNNDATKPSDGSQVTSAPTPGDFNYNTPTPLPGSEGEKGSGFSFEFGAVHWVVISVLGVFLLILLVRWIYILAWRRKLKSRSKNDSARAYYRYYRMILNNYGKRPSHRITALAQRAAFSQEGLSDEQYRILVQSGKELIQSVEKDSTFRRRFIGKHILGIPGKML